MVEKVIRTSWNKGKKMNYSLEERARRSKKRTLMNFQNNPMANQSVREKVSTTKKRLYLEGKIKVWNKNKTNIYSLETLEKFRQKQLGKKMSEESKHKISDSLKGIPFSEEHKKKIGLAQKGRNLGKTFEEIHGIKKAIHIKKKIASNNWAHEMKGNFPIKTLEKKKLNMLGKNNPMYGIKGINSPFWKGGDVEYYRRVYHNNINYRLKNRVRNRIRQMLNKKIAGGKTTHSICYGINVQEIVNYLIKNAPQDYLTGQYDIHHVKPLIRFELNDSEQLKQAFAPENHLIVSKEEHKKLHKVTTM